MSQLHSVAVLNCSKVHEQGKVGKDSVAAVNCRWLGSPLGQASDPCRLILLRWRNLLFPGNKYWQSLTYLARRLTTFDTFYSSKSICILGDRRIQDQGVVSQIYDADACFAYHLGATGCQCCPGGSSMWAELGIWGCTWRTAIVQSLCDVHCPACPPAFCQR